MKIKRFITVSKRGNTKISVNKPSLRMDEIAIQVNFEIPDQLFVKPTLVADISVDEKLATQQLISADVIDNAKKLLSDTLGLELRVSTVDMDVEERESETA